MFIFDVYQRMTNLFNASLGMIFVLFCIGIKEVLLLLVLKVHLTESPQRPGIGPWN